MKQISSHPPDEYIRNWLRKLICLSVWGFKHRVLKAMNFRTCSHYFLAILLRNKNRKVSHMSLSHSTWWKKYVQKSQILAPWKAHWLYSSLSLPTIKTRSPYVMNMGWEKIFPLEIYDNFKNMEISFDCFVKHCDIKFQNLWKITCVSHLCYTYV